MSVGLGLGLGLGCAGGSGGASFDPEPGATLLYEQGAYAAGVWTKRVGHDTRSVIGSPPAASSGSPNFAGAEQIEVGAATETASDYFTTAMTGFAVIDPGTPGAAASMINVFSNDNVWSLRTNGNAGLSIQEDTGIYSCTFWIYNGAVQRAEVTLPDLGRRTVHWRYFWDGVSAGYVQIGLDGVWETAVPISAAIDATAASDRIDFGRNYSASRFYTGLLDAFGLYNAIKDDAFVTGLVGLYG